jgi:2-Cys peroxiredoxin 5
MASTTIFRRLALNVSRPTRAFHSSARALIKVGDQLPNLNVLVENSPGNKINLTEAIKGKALIIGVPAAFSTSFIASYGDIFDELRETHLYCLTN